MGINAIEPPVAISGRRVGTSVCRAVSVTGKESDSSGAYGSGSIGALVCKWNALNAFSCIWPDILTFSGNGGIGGPRG